ncbi:MAG: hypothetical protein ACK4KV_19020 [Rhodocyclaceae bacterium]
MKTPPMDLPAADAAKLVRREVPEVGKDGKPTGKLADKAVAPDEVFAVAVRDQLVTVVTTDGRKLSGTLPAAKAEK